MRLELEQIATPTLVISGTADTDVPPSHSDHAYETISGAARLVMDGGTHLSLFAHPEAELARERVVGFLRSGGVAS